MSLEKGFKKSSSSVRTSDDIVLVPSQSSGSLNVEPSPRKSTQAQLETEGWTQLSEDVKKTRDEIKKLSKDTGEKTSEQRKEFTALKENFTALKENFERIRFDLVATVSLIAGFIAFLSTSVSLYKDISCLSAAVWYTLLLGMFFVCVLSMFFWLLLLSNGKGWWKFIVIGAVPVLFWLIFLGMWWNDKNIDAELCHKVRESVTTQAKSAQILTGLVDTEAASVQQ